MNLQYLTTHVFGFVLALAFSNLALAEQKVEQGNYVVHYNAFTSTAIGPSVASSYDIRRSKYRGIVNITPQLKTDDESIQGIKAKVSGNARNLLGNRQNLVFKEIVEENVIYYIAEFSFSNEEQFTFTIELLPENASQTVPVVFSKKFYVH